MAVTAAAIAALLRGDASALDALIWLASPAGMVNAAARRALRAVDRSTMTCAFPVFARIGHIFWGISLGLASRRARSGSAIIGGVGATLQATGYCGKPSAGCHRHDSRPRSFRHSRSNQSSPISAVALPRKVAAALWRYGDDFVLRNCTRHQQVSVCSTRNNRGTPALATMCC